MRRTPRGQALPFQIYGRGLGEYWQGVRFKGDGPRDYGEAPSGVCLKGESDVRCSWVHCEASFKDAPGPLPSGWRWVCRHTSTGERVVVCPEHAPELLAADLRALLRCYPPVPAPSGSLAETGELPRLSDGEPEEPTRRHSRPPAGPLKRPLK